MLPLRAALVLALGLGLPAPSQAGWEGHYGGIHAARGSHDFATGYDHSRFGTCTNLNFGAEWPGEGCEGNQDYTTAQRGRAATRAVGLSLERLNERGGRVLGWQVNLERAAVAGTEFSQVLSTTWGDRLDVAVATRGSVDVRFVFGLPRDIWLPYVSVGAGLERVAISFTQDQIGYDVPATGSTEDWTQRLVLGVGVKRDLGQGWVLGTELNVSRSGPAHLAAEGGLYSYGLRYPDTDIDSTIEATSLRIGLSRRF